MNDIEPRHRVAFVRDWLEKTFLTIIGNDLGTEIAENEPHRIFMGYNREIISCKKFYTCNTFAIMDIYRGCVTEYSCLRLPTTC